MPSTHHEPGDVIMHWTVAFRKKGACQEAINWARNYPTFREFWNACERGDWMEWGINSGLVVLPVNRKTAFAPVQKAYDEACGAARKAYDEACGTAWKAYAVAIRREFPDPKLRGEE